MKNDDSVNKISDTKIKLIIHGLFRMLLNPLLELIEDF